MKNRIKQLIAELKSSNEKRNLANVEWEAEHRYNIIRDGGDVCHLTFDGHRTSMGKTYEDAVTELFALRDEYIKNYGSR